MSLWYETTIDIYVYVYDIHNVHLIINILEIDHMLMYVYIENTVQKIYFLHKLCT